MTATALPGQRGQPAAFPHRLTLFLRKYSVAYLFIAVPVIATIVFLFVPMVVSFWWSLNDYSGLQPPRFIGLQNYVDLFQDPKFLRALWNTTAYVVIGMAIGPTLGLLTALMLNQKVRIQAFFRTAYFLPVMTSAVVVALVWRILYNWNGVLNYLLISLGLERIRWLSDPHVVLPALAVAGIWQGFGFETVIYLAALQAIPKTYYEAAEIDGANGWQQFWNVTVPSLRPVIFFVYVIGIIGSYQVFDLVYAMMNARPNPSPEHVTLVYYLFSKFRDLRLGYASAIAYVLFVILVIFSFLQWRLSQERE